MSTTVFAAQDALLAALQDATWVGQKPAIGLGVPVSPQRRHVWISGEVDNWTKTYAQSGLAASDEAFELRVHCLADVVGDYTDARAAVHAMGEVVAGVVAADPVLGGAVGLVVVARMMMEESISEDGKGRQAMVTLYLSCKSYVVA